VSAVRVKQWCVCVWCEVLMLFYRVALMAPDARSVYSMRDMLLAHPLHFL